MDSLGEVAAHLCQGGKKEVSEAVPLEVARGEAVLKELGEQGLVFG